ncbi:MAG: phosphatidic acid phosphatase [Chloroflexi bacterium]|nr:MAG: phosphatidic acid phosphatase [Chloroflexota bacterium]
MPNNKQRCDEQQHAQTKDISSVRQSEAAMRPRAAPRRANSANSTSQSSQPRWLLVQGFHDTLQRFAQAWAQLPYAAKRVFLRTLAVGWLASAAIMLGLVWVARLAIDDETAFFLLVSQLNPVSFHAAIWAETPGNSVFLIPLMLAAAIVAIRWQAPLRALAIVAAFVVIDTLVLLGWLVWDRARPTLIADGIAAPGFHSFPSGHVAQTITVYGLLTYFWLAAARRRSEQAFGLLVCVVLIVIVGLARLGLGTHWPSDLLAGAVIGGVWLAVIILALRKAEASRTQHAAHGGPPIG